MSYDSGGSMSTFGDRRGDGGKAGDTSTLRGDGLAELGGGVVNDTNDTFTSPPFRGGGGGAHSPYAFADHAEVVEQQYEMERSRERERRLNLGFAPAQYPPYQFANTSRSPRGGARGGEGDVSAKRSRPSYNSDEDVQPTRAFGASPGTKRAMSEMMATNLLRLNVSPTGAASPTGGPGAYPELSLSLSSDGGLASAPGAVAGGWPHAHGQGQSQGQGRGQEQGQGSGAGSAVAPSGESTGGGDSQARGGGVDWLFGSVCSRSISLCEARGLPLTCEGAAYGSFQAPPSPFGLQLARAPAGRTSVTPPGAIQASVRTHGRDKMLCGVDADKSDESEQQLTSPGKQSPVHSAFLSGVCGDGFKLTFAPSPTATAPGGGTHDMHTSQPQQQLVLPELLLRRRSALSQQLSAGIPVGLAALGTPTASSSNFLLGSGGTAGDLSAMMPSSPSAEMSPRSDLRKQAILNRASLMHATGPSPSPKYGGGSYPSVTSPTSPSSPRSLTPASPAMAAVPDEKMAARDIEGNDDRGRLGDTHEFDMDTPI
uniref:Uncharacterized protein n=1 Tax=Mantoniella antarctica TaxID=81844 RepID=A0A7S0SV34_9CHLO